MQASSVRFVIKCRDFCEGAHHFKSVPYLTFTQYVNRSGADMAGDSD